MNRREAALLLRTVIAYCPSQTIDDLTPDAWAEALSDTRFVDARQAVANLGRMDLEPGKSRYIEVGHVRGEVKRIRRKRIDGADYPTPPRGLSFSEERDWLRRAWDAIADGDPVPDQPQLTNRPVPDFAAITKAIPR